MENYERYAGALTVVFGAVVICSLVAANIASGNKPGFLCALAAAICAWAAAPAVLFLKPALYRGLTVCAVLFVAASIALYL